MVITMKNEVFGLIFELIIIIIGMPFASIFNCYFYRRERVRSIVSTMLIEIRMLINLKEFLLSSNYLV